MGQRNINRKLKLLEMIQKNYGIFSIFEFVSMIICPCSCVHVCISVCFCENVTGRKYQFPIILACVFVCSCAWSCARVCVYICFCDSLCVYACVVNWSLENVGDLLSSPATTQCTFIPWDIFKLITIQIVINYNDA